MKFHDLFKEQFIVNINEVFDTKIPPNSWTTEVDGTKVGHLKINEADYYIRLEPKTYAFEKVTYTFINIAFTKLINGKESEKLTYDNKTGSKVLGAISNAMRDELQKYEADAIVFIATDHVEKRMSIYNKLIREFGGKGFLSSMRNVKIPNGLMTIIFNKKFPDKVHKSFIEHLKTLKKL